MKQIEILEITQAELAHINAEIAAHTTKWRQIPSLLEMGLDASGKGDASDLIALDYIIYEHLYSIFFAHQRDFFALATFVFGNCMCKILGLRWCAFELTTGRTLGLFHAENGIRLPLEPLIIAKLSGRPQFESFSELLLDIYLMVGYWPIGSHYMMDACNLDASEFNEHWGFKVPEDILKRWQLLTYVNEDRAFRIFGIYAYDWLIQPSWQLVRQSLAVVEHEFTDCCGPSWREWAEKNVRERSV